jgi:hypothetical protein
VESPKEETPAIDCHLVGGLLADTWRQEWSPLKKGMTAIGCQLVGELFPLTVITWKQEWSPPRKGCLLLAVTWLAAYSYWLLPGSRSGVPQGRDACYWLSPGRRIIPIGCYLEAGVMIAIGCHLAGGLFLLAVTWKQEWSPTRNG